MAKTVAPPSERRGIRRVIGDDAKQDWRARGVDVGDHAQRRTPEGEHEGNRKSQALEGHVFRGSGWWPPPWPQAPSQSSITCSEASGFKGLKVWLV
jgi:hypothetical protein